MKSELDTSRDFGLIPRDFFERPLFRSPLFRRFSDEMQRLFEEPARQLGRTEGPWFPDIEVLTDKETLVVRADLPGLKPEEVQIEVTEDQLVLKGERRRKTTEEKKDFYRSERSYGRFLRTVPLPEGAITDGAKATFTNGVLEITVPIPPRAEPKARQVKIETVGTEAPAHK